MRDTLFLFASFRAIKQFYEKCDEGPLPQVQSLGEFFSNIIYIKDKIKIPGYLRSLFLHEAICENKDSSLGDFGVNFADFLDNSSFFLSFFDELCAGCLAIDSLKNSDTYAFYDDHLSVLEKIYQSYLEKLSAHNFYFHPFLEDYHLALELLVDIQKIEVYVDGFLSRFDLKILKEISRKIPFLLHLEINAFNQAYYTKLFDLTLDKAYYKLSLSEEKFVILETNAKENALAKISIASFKDKITQCGGIFLQLDKWLNAGVRLEDICIVLPNEDFVEFLKLFDSARNLNYAMGADISTSNLFLNLKENAKNFSSFVDFRAFLDGLNAEDLSAFDKKVKEKIENVLEEFQFILEKNFAFDFESLFMVFLERLRDERIDDIGGGRISVIGILETRGVDFNYVILPEFNEGNVPKVSDKDIFLNTNIRKKVSLPIRSDRENLQKHYYYELFKNSKEVFISHLDNDEVQPSRFLLDNSIFKDAIKMQENSLAQSYFVEGVKLEYKEVEIVEPFVFESFSYSSLHTFLTCKRKYYYQYVKKYKDTFTKKEFNLGTLIHELLCKIYKENPLEVLKKDLQNLLFSALQNAQENENLTQKDIFNITLAKRYLQNFIAFEKERLNAGFVPVFLEREFHFSFDGVLFRAKLDRVDRKGNDFVILDYKYKKDLKVDNKDLQLFLYTLALKNEVGATKIDAMLYDLREGRLLNDEKILEKKELLSQVLSEIKANTKAMNFAKCEKKTACVYCPYVYLCNRY